MLFARSIDNAMQLEIARHQNYDDHYADDGEDVHFALLPLHDNGATCLRTKCPPLKPFTIATAYIPNSRPLQRAERAQGQ
jgi:hypothetical protein